MLLKALEYIPNSLTLWQAAIKNEDENAARLLLHRAVENIPTNVDLWLALAKLETYNEAKNVLNKVCSSLSILFSLTRLVKLFLQVLLFGLHLPN